SVARSPGTESTTATRQPHSRFGHVNAQIHPAGVPGSSISPCSTSNAGSSRRDMIMSASWHGVWVARYGRHQSGVRPGHESGAVRSDCEPAYATCIAATPLARGAMGTRRAMLATNAFLTNMFVVSRVWRHGSPSCSSRGSDGRADWQIEVILH